MATAPDVPVQRLQREVVRLAHRGLDLEGFLSAAEARLSAVLAHDGAVCFFTVDPATMLITGHHNRDLAADDARRRAVNAGVMENEYREADFNKFVDLARDPRRAESLEAATGGRPQRSRRFHSLLQPFGLEGELRAALVVDGSCWGVWASSAPPTVRHSVRASGEWLPPSPLPSLPGFAALSPSTPKAGPPLAAVRPSSFSTRRGGCSR